MLLHTQTPSSGHRLKRVAGSDNLRPGHFEVARIDGEMKAKIAQTEEELTFENLHKQLKSALLLVGKPDTRVSKVSLFKNLQRLDKKAKKEMGAVKRVIELSVGRLKLEDQVNALFTVELSPSQQHWKLLAGLAMLLELGYGDQFETPYCKIWLRLLGSQDFAVNLLTVCDRSMPACLVAISNMQDNQKFCTKKEKQTLKNALDDIMPASDQAGNRSKQERICDDLLKLTKTHMQFKKDENPIEVARECCMGWQDYNVFATI